MPMILLVNEKGLENIQQPIKIKIDSKLGMEENFLKLIKRH